jgi:TfoX/Sxy family transcriptional regulator of competence genes
MAYDEELADRIRALLEAEPRLSEKKMFGGLAFLVEGNMAIAASGEGGILVRVDPDASGKLVDATKAEVAVMRNRPMAGWLRVATEHVRTKQQLAKWVNLGVTYEAIMGLGVLVTRAERVTIAQDGQVRLDWDESYLDVFFATTPLHYEMATLARGVRFGPVDIPILSPEHLIVCKAVFDRPKDWLDIEEMVAWGTPIEASVALRWVADLLGCDAEQHTRLAALLATQA